MPAIHQLVAGFAPGDAISNEAVLLQRIFKSWGSESEIFCNPAYTQQKYQALSRDLAGMNRDINPEDTVILHLSTGSEVNRIFAGLSCRKAIIYHNMTPSSYFTLVNPKVAGELEKGRAQLKSLACAASVNTAVSRFNALELEAQGYRDVKVLPLILDLDLLVAEPAPEVLERYGDGTTNVLFVGRGAPNKKIEDVITSFYYFKKHVCRDSRLIHVGSFAGMDPYRLLIKSQAAELGLPRESVIFAGTVTQAQLNAYYSVADLFLCMSEHEGFCIPLLESMLHKVPVVAYSAAAVPETLDGAGVLVREKNFEAIAEIMGEIINSRQLKDAVVAKQNDRIRKYKARDLASELKSCLAL